jgi:hypothetical protein
MSELQIESIKLDCIRRAILNMKHTWWEVKKIIKLLDCLSGASNLILEFL